MLIILSDDILESIGKEYIKKKNMVKYDSFVKDFKKKTNFSLHFWPLIESLSSTWHIPEFDFSDEDLSHETYYKEVDKILRLKTKFIYYKCSGYEKNFLNDIPINVLNGIYGEPREC